MPPLLPISSSTIATSVSDEASETQLSHTLAILSGFLRNEINEASTPLARCIHLRKRIQVMEEALLEVGRLETARRCLRAIKNISSSPAPPTRSGSPSLSTSIVLHNTRRTSQTHAHSLEEEGGPTHSSLPLPPAKRRRLTPSPPTSYPNPNTNPNSTSNENMSTGSTSPFTPCLRCKILKKRCSTQPSCTNCSTNISSTDTTTMFCSTTETEFWKPLPCIRDFLSTSLTPLFLPPFSRSTSRQLFGPGAATVPNINYFLMPSHVSIQKRRRIEYLIQSSADFASLSSSAWDIGSSRKGLSLSAASPAVPLTPVSLPGPISTISPSLSSNGNHNSNLNPTANADTEPYEAVWAVLQCVLLAPCYLSPTAYNLFTLIRLGNSFSASEPESYKLYTHTLTLLRQSVELYLLERLSAEIASGNMTNPPPFSSTANTPNTLMHVDLLPTITSFLHDFEALCSSRGKISGSLQRSCFYSLLIFSITKSILIDAYSVRAEYENPNPWSEKHAVEINSAWKVLVSVFCWASRRDVVLQEAVNAGPGEENMRSTQELVQSDMWEERGFKGTKDFLLSLGSCYFTGGVYNGFFVQKYGRERLETYVPKPKSSKAPDFMVNTFSIGRSLEQSPTPSDSTVGESPKFVFVDQDNSPKRQSKRKGALDAAVLENAREVRKIGACWNCWAMKVTCSEGLKCDRCEHKLGSKAYRLCNRGAFTKFTDIFFPDFLTSPFSLEETKQYIAQNTDGFSSSDIDIEILWGQIPMKLQARIFTPTANGVVEKMYLTSVEGSPGMASLPVGVIQNEIEVLNLETKCLDQLRVVLEGPLFFAQVPEREVFPLSNSILGILLDFHKAERNSLLENTFMLYLSICATTCPVIFNPSTKASILEKRGNISLPNINYSSRILNLQIKHVMFKACHRLVTQVLEEFEKIIRKRSKESWPVLFATLTLLCFCIEEIQLAIAIHTSYAEAPIYGEPQNSCHALEEVPYGQLTSVFHILFRTMKTDNGGVNPLRDDNSHIPASFGGSALVMVSKIKSHILSVGGKEVLGKRSKSLEFGSGFSPKNYGHLIAQFLLSFLEPVGKPKS